jgi:hypothetical protein
MTTQPPHSWTTTVSIFAAGMVVWFGALGGLAVLT